MRLIDADKLKKAIQDYYLSCALDNEVYDIIDNAPTVESKTIAECIIAYGDGYETARRLYERPQGEWINMLHHPFGHYLARCNNCNVMITTSHISFCPNCGAEMIHQEVQV